MNLDDFSTVVDDRRYINPQVSLDEQNAFINNLRSTQQARNEEIATDTASKERRDSYRYIQPRHGSS